MARIIMHHDGIALIFLGSSATFITFFAFFVVICRHHCIFCPFTMQPNKIKNPYLKENNNKRGRPPGSKDSIKRKRTTSAERAIAKTAQQIELDRKKATFFQVPNPQQQLASQQQQQQRRDTALHLNGVPVIFHDSVQTIMNSLRSTIKSSTRQSNQHQQQMMDSVSLPWNSEEYKWPSPFKLKRPATIMDFLAPYFCRLQYFGPDRYAPHWLPTRRLPCKWHGFSLDPKTKQPCTCHDLVFCNFVRSFIDVDGSVGMLFSGRYYCSVKARKSAAGGTVGTVEDDDLPVEDHEYYFVGHCDEVLQHLTPEVKSLLGLVLTKRLGMTTELSDHVFERVSSKQSFNSVVKELSVKQRNKFFRLKQEFHALYFNPATNGFSKISTDASQAGMSLCYSDVAKGTVPSRQYLQQAFVDQVLPQLPYYERSLEMMR